MKKALAILLATVLLAGCAVTKNPVCTADRTDEPAAVEEAPAAATDGAPGGTDGYYGMLYVGEGGDSETNVDASAAESDVNAVLVQGGSLIMRDASVEKSGDATGTAATGGGNAAAAAVAGGQLALAGCTVVSDGYGAHGLFAAGANTYLTTENTAVTVRGGTSAAAFATEAGIIQITGGSLTVEDASGTSPALLLGGGGVVELSGVQVSCGAGMAAEVVGIATSVTLAQQTLSGDISMGEDAECALTIGDGSEFSGTFLYQGAADVSVTLSESGVWRLTADTDVDVFIDADMTFANVVSNGFSITYDAEDERNAWLNHGAYELPGGGFIVPII